MPRTPCGCRLIRCTDSYDPFFADNLGVWWQVSCGCRLYPCVDEVTSHSPSPASSRASSTDPVATHFVVPHNTSREPFPGARQPNLTLDDSWDSTASPHCQPIELLDSDLSHHRRIQREVDATREQLRQVEKERDELKIRLRKVTEETLWQESAANFHNGFLAHNRSAKESSELDNPSSDWPDSDDATRRSSFNRGRVNDHHSPQCCRRRPFNHRTFFARTQDDSLISKPSTCCCTSITSSDAGLSAFPSSVSLGGKRSFPVCSCKYCAWCRYQQQPDCGYSSLSGVPDASSFSTSGTTGSTTSDTNRTDTRQSRIDRFATNQCYGNPSSTFWQEYVSGSRYMKPLLRAPASQYHPYSCGYGSHICCPKRGRPTSLGFPCAMPRFAPNFHEHVLNYHSPPQINSSRAVSGTILRRRLMLASYTIMTALVAIVATTPAEDVEVKRVSGVLLGLVGSLAVIPWLVGRNKKRRMVRRVGIEG